MKKVSMLLCAGVLMSALCAAVVACNNSNGDDEQRRIELAKLTDDVYYVAGYYEGLVEIQDDGTAKCGSYLFISENLQDTVSVYNRIGTEDWRPGRLLDGIFEFPAEIMPRSITGYVLFSAEYRYSYPVKINSHRPMTENEAFVPDHDMLRPGSSIQPNKYIFVESLSKIEEQ
jgi:hypothetical protein